LSLQPSRRSNSARVARVTFDATTWQVRSIEFLSSNGNETATPADSSCDTIVPALT